MVLSHRILDLASVRRNCQKGLKEMEVTVCCQDGSSLKLEEGVCHDFSDCPIHFSLSRKAVVSAMWTRTSFRGLAKGRYFGGIVSIETKGWVKYCRYMKILKISTYMQFILAALQSYLKNPQVVLHEFWYIET